MEYTKGEWEIVGNSIYARPTIDKPEIVCYVQGQNTEANIQLIASAPDLYEACKTTAKQIDTFRKTLSSYDSWNALQEKIQKAIAKAEGK